MFVFVAAACALDITTVKSGSNADSTDGTYMQMNSILFRLSYGLI